MKRYELEHIIRAIGAITQYNEFVIIGSQAILANYPDAPDELTVSQEVDTYPLENPDIADLIDGSIGELSPFHEQFGYYAHGIGPNTASLAKNWRDRAAEICNENTRFVKGICLSPVDIAISKLIAGREKDFSYVTYMLQSGMISFSEIEKLTDELRKTEVEILKRNLGIIGARSDQRDNR